jgi:hypothetical protein
MSDKYGFKKAFMAMAGVQALTLGVYDQLAASKISFALGTMSVYFTLGGACSGAEWSGVQLGGDGTGICFCLACVCCCLVGFPEGG